MSPPKPVPHRFLLRLAAPLALVLVTHPPTGAMAAEAPRGLKPSTDANQIDGLSIEELDDGTTVLRVQGTRKPTFNVYRLSGPERLVVDIAGSEPGRVVPHVPLDTWACGRVTVDGVQERDASLVRLVVELKRDASYIVVPKEHHLVVTVTPRQGAPEAYFARKSAAQRRDEIERTSRDAAALKAEARVLHSQAQHNAHTADRKAQAARATETRARAAEQRAAAIEAQARRTLLDANGGKLKLRRALRQAEHARVAAQSERKQAQSERRKAERSLAHARAELEAERVELEQARGRTEQERAKLVRARTRAAQAEAAANAELQRAQARTHEAEAEAEATLSNAHAKAEQADRKAAQVLASAQAKLRAAEAAAKAQLRQAHVKSQRVDAAQVKLEQAQAEAVADLRRARASAKQAQLELEQVRTQAQVELKQARAKAQAQLDNARASAKQAEAQRRHVRIELDKARVAERAATIELARAKAKSEALHRDAATLVEQAKAQRAEAERVTQRDQAAAAAALTQAEHQVAAAKQMAKASTAEAQKIRQAAAAQAAQELQKARRNAAATEARAHRLLATAAATVSEAEQQAAETQREAQRAERRAKLLLVEAQAKAQFESDQMLAAAKQTRDQAHRDAVSIVAQAQAQAKQKVAEATTVAQRTAQQRQIEAEQRAEQRVHQARAQAQADAIKRAERELADVRATAKREAAHWVATAKQAAEREAASDVHRARTRAEAIEAQAHRKLADAESTLAQARTDAAHQKKSAATLQHQAQSALTRAEQAQAEAEAERRAAVIARKAADHTLDQAKQKVRQARQRGTVTQTLQRSLAKAQDDQQRAHGRLTVAKNDLARLRADRKTLERTLTQQKALSAALAGKVDARNRELAALHKRVAEVQKELHDRDRSASAERLAAQSQAQRARAAQAQLSKEVARLRAVAHQARTKAFAAERNVQRLERAADQPEALASAKAEAEATRSQAKVAQSEVREAKARLSEVDARVKQGQVELARLGRERKALTREGAALREQNATARSTLEHAQADLASLRSELEQERSALRGVEHEARVAAQASKPSRVEPPATTTSDSKAMASAVVQDIRFEDGADESTVWVELSGPVQFSDTTLTPGLQVLALQGARLDARLERSLDTRAYNGPVERITSFSEEGGAKVIVATRGKRQARLELTKNTLIWHFPHEPPPRPTPSSASPLQSAQVGGYVVTAPPPVSVVTSAVAAAPSSARSVGAPSPSRASSSARARRWTGERIDIQLQATPIKDVLILFSDIGRVNIIAGRNVEGVVTMNLKAVPWDQALDIILRSLSLGMVQEGNVIRVATTDDLNAERREAIEQANARVQLKPLQTRLVPISYATVDEMIPKVQSVLSPRGTVTPDSRTNTLIVMDVADNIALAEQLVTSLDTQTPQVLIEARIVEARTTFVRQLGIQWGFDFTASPGTGNPTGLLFPNALGIGGGATGVPVDSRGLVLPGSAANPNYVVDLPAPVGTGAGGALGFSFGSISGNLNTNLRLSQSEETGEVRIISAPKIVTLDNSEAQIEEGVQIPISQVSAQGVNTRFVNATLSLRVTPHVTNEGAVLLDVQVQKNEADFINTGARGDPTILTKQARSRMLVNDSDTAVIGGIYSRNKAVSFTKVPWLADIPIIGWFFKNKSEADTRSEVLIFLTPKIVNRASSIGG